MLITLFQVFALNGELAWIKTNNDLGISANEETKSGNYNISFYLSTGCGRQNENFFRLNLVVEVLKYFLRNSG
jgi:hypothetical protein